MIGKARALAERALAGALPQRWMHVQAVARQAGRMADALPHADGAVLVAAAWLHDVGYSPAAVQIGLHPLDGARWLRGHLVESRVCDLVAYHSCARFEARERGLLAALEREFRDEGSIVSDMLWYADMTTGPSGQRLTVDERLAEIRSRYGPVHVVTRFWAGAEPVLMEAVGRVEFALAEHGAAGAS